MPHAVLFDLDGTLLDTLADIAEATNRALRELGLSEHPVDAYRRMVGSGIDVLAERALGEAATQESVAFVVQHARSRMAENAHTRPYDGVSEALTELGKHFRLAVLSNKPHEIVVETTRRFFPTVRFDSVVGQRQGIPEKPDPTVALEMMRELDAIAPTVYIGDSDVDMATAKNAGMVGVGAGWGFRGRNELEGAGAHVVIDHPNELVQVVHSIVQGAGYE